MRVWILVALVAIGAVGCDDPETRVLGAGARASLSTMAVDYRRYDPNALIVYDLLDSYRGIELFLNETVDYAATEVPVPDNRAGKGGAGLTQIPLTVGAAVLAFNVKNIKQLNLSQAFVAGIYLGKVTLWCDPRIQVLNPNAVLPDLPIIPVHRVNGSGSTYTFTNFLSKNSQVWRNTIGSGSLIKWLTKPGAQGSLGILQSIRCNPNAVRNLIDDVGLVNIQNREGRPIEPNVKSIKEAVGNAEGARIVELNWPLFRPE